MTNQEIDNFKLRIDKCMDYFEATFPCEGSKERVTKYGNNTNEFYICSSYNEDFKHFFYGYTFNIFNHNLSSSDEIKNVFPEYYPDNMEVYKNLSFNEFLTLKQYFDFLQFDNSIFEKFITNDKEKFYTDEKINKNFILYLEGYIFNNYNKQK